MGSIGSEGQVRIIQSGTAQVILAKTIVAAYYNAAEAQAAEDRFNLIFRQHEVPEGTAEFKTDLTPNDEGEVYPTELIVNAGLAVSAGEAHRLIDGGGVKVYGGSDLRKKAPGRSGYPQRSSDPSRKTHVPRIGVVRNGHLFDRF